MPRRPPRSLRFASLGNLFREARRASPQRQNNGACASDGAGLPWLSRKLRPEDCFGKPDGPAPSAEITERARATARVCHGCQRPRSPRFASLGNLFREARRANSQRQNVVAPLPPARHPRGQVLLQRLDAPVHHGNDGSEREGSFGHRPENCFGKSDGPAPSAKITERARATARVCHGCRGSFGRRPKSCFEKPDGPAPSVKITGASVSDAPPPRLSRKLRPSPRKLPDGPDPSVKTTGTSFRAARRARPKPKPSTILRIAKNGTRRARAGFLRTLNPKRF